MERGSGECENCRMVFEDPHSLARHQAKFCTNSKYGSSAVFGKEHDDIAQGRDLSLLGRNYAPTLSRAKAYEQGYFTNHAAPKETSTGSIACSCGRSAGARTSRTSWIGSAGRRRSNLPCWR